MAPGSLRSPFKLRRLRQIAVSFASGRLQGSSFLNIYCKNYSASEDNDGIRNSTFTRTINLSPFEILEGRTDRDFSERDDWNKAKLDFRQSQARSGFSLPFRLRKFGTAVGQGPSEGSIGLKEVQFGRTDHMQMKSGVRTLPFSLNFKRYHSGHSQHDHPPEERGKAGEQVLEWGLWSDIVLAIGKGGAGYVSGSTAIIADAAHSVSDIALSGVALWSSKVAKAPKDKEHPYGHGKFETLGALCISGMLILTGGGIGWHALETLQAYIPLVSELVHTTTDSLNQHEHNGGGHHHGIDMEHPFVALSAALFSILVKEALYWKTKAVGEQQKSELLKASAWHHRSDAISSVVALLGVGGAMLGMPLLDPLAGLLVSAMIVKAGVETGYQSMQELVDMGVPESELSPIRSTVRQVSGVEGCHHLRGRRTGSLLHIDAHIEVDPWLSVSAAYQIGQAVRHQVQKEHPEVAETFVHIEPADGGSKTLTPGEAEEEARKDNHSIDESDKLSGGKPDFKKTDLVKDGSKSDLVTGSLLDKEVISSGDPRHPSEVEDDVRRVVQSHFIENMRVAHVTSHYLKGKVVVEVEVTMNPGISVRDAMETANDAHDHILKEISDIHGVNVQLKLSRSPDVA